MKLLSNFLIFCLLAAVGLAQSSSATGPHLGFGPVSPNSGSSLPSQTGNAGKFLTTDGTNASWITLAGGGDMLLGGIQAVTGAKTFNSGKMIFAGSTSGTTILNANATAGSGTVFLPLTGTLVTLDGTETLTAKSLTSPTLTGVPTAPTATLGTNTTQLATTAFVLANAGSGGITALTGAITASGTGSVATSLGSFTFSALNTALTGDDAAGLAAVNVFTGASTHAGIESWTGASIKVGTAVSGNAVDVSKQMNFQSLTAGVTITFTGSPTSRQWFGYEITADSGGPYTVTLPASVYPIGSATALSSISIPASSTVIVYFIRNGSNYLIASNPPVTTGSGSVYALQTSPTFITPKTDFTATIGTDDTYTGDVISGLNNSGGVTQWDAVYLNSSSQWVKADANGSGTFPAVGIAVSTATTGNPVTVLVRGVFRDDGGTSWTVGGNLYLSTTAGGMSSSAPTTTGDKVQVMGTALAAHTVYFHPGTDYGTAP